MKSSLFVALIVICAISIISCEEERTGTCTTTCYSKSTGANFGSYSYENYTRKECEQSLEDRETNLTDCVMEWD